MKRIKQVLINCLSNSIKFTRVGFVKVEAQLLDQRTILFKIIDSGSGISDRDKENLFKAFGKGRDSADQNIQGSGLGLNICQRLVDKLGGEISIESQVGEGTTVSFTIRPERIQL
jgi:signal transduction histidine kinase